MEEVTTQPEEVKTDSVDVLKRGPGRPPKVQVTDETPSSETVPVAAPPEAVKEPTAITDPCWNCGKQLVFDKCEACGFDKTLIRNPDLDSKREASRRKITSQ